MRIAERVGRMWTAVTLLAGAIPGVAGERYHDRALDELTYVEGELPAGDERMRWVPFGVGSALQPYAVLDGGGEAYVHAHDGDPNRAPWNEMALCVRVDEGVGEVSGRLFLPVSEGLRVLRFRMSTGTAGEAAGEAFLRAKRDHYGLLLDRGVPGAAWFRHQYNAAARALSESERDEPQVEARRPRAGDLEDSYALFSGGRALAENLQLDRQLPSDGGEGANIPIDTLQGITVKEFDWSELTAGLEPELDPLAGCIPDDQHAVFFPDLPALIDVLDEAMLHGTPVLDLLEPRSEDARTRERYETQLCLPLDVWARTLGPLAVGEIAITGSDPYLRSGSDVAVLMQAKDAAALEAFLRARREAAAVAHPGTELGEGGVRGLMWHTAVSADRRVSSYAMTVGDVVIVTNSSAQLARIVATVQSERPSLDDSSEYVFFRDRYRRGEGREKAFAMLTDATIRRWCSPHWRIGVARRTWDTALVAEDYAASIASAPADRIRGGDWAMRPELEFQTPVTELDVTRVTAAERDAYNRFRNRYQSNWRAFFDPIAIRIGVEEGRTSFDVSVWPLIDGTDYDRVFSFSRGARFEPDAGDPHGDALAHVILGINKESDAFRSLGSWAGAFGMELTNPLGWVGDSVAVYADRDPFWKEWSDAAAEDDRDVFIEDELYRVPVVARVAVSDPLRLTAFLTALRGLSDQAAPNMVLWENREHAGATYVRIASAAPMGELNDDMALYYAPLPEALIVTLNEAALQRALERRASPDPADAELVWLGESAGFRLDARAIDWLRTVWSDEWTRRARRRSWGNLAALNEWRRLFPGGDAVAMHETLWGTRLRCPGGGRYEWNDEWQSYASTVYGHPAYPAGDHVLAPVLEDLLTLALGLTLEEEGLRARAEITRALSR